MDLQQAFINSLYLLGIVIVAVFIAELIMTMQRKSLAMKAFKKAIEGGEVHVHRIDKFEGMEDKETDFK